jgi:hypothetical protein
MLSGHLLENVNKICDLGMILDTKLNFISHIDSIINKDSRMLGYIKRIGKDFTDPYTLRTLYNTFVRSNLDYAGVIWSPYYGVHIDRIEAVQRKFVRFVLRFLGWQTGVVFSPYCQRCKLID